MIVTTEKIKIKHGQSYMVSTITLLGIIPIYKKYTLL